MAYNRKKNRYGCTYDEVLRFLKEQGHEVTNRKALDEAAVQTHYEAHTQAHANDALQSLEKAVRKKAKGLIDRIPDSTALPLLFWMSHQYSLESINDHGRIEPKPRWLNFEYVYDNNDEIKPALHYGYSREEVKSLLIECFNTSPRLFISNTSILSRHFKNTLNSKSVYSSDLRLKNFISYHLPEPKNIEEYATTHKLTENYKKFYSIEGIPSQKGLFIITLLSAAYSHPRWKPDSFFENWPKLLKCDTAALDKIEDSKLLPAAEEALKKPFSTRSDIVMEIDLLTNYEYTVLASRRKYYRRIKHHLNKHSPKNKAEAVNTSFTVSQDFFQLTKLNPKLKSEENVRQAIAETLDNIEKAKKAIVENNFFVANRSALPSISSRLNQETSNQLDALAKKLKGKNGLPARKNCSIALELAILFKTYIDSTRRKDTYPSHTSPNDGYARFIQLRKEAEAAAQEREAKQGTVTALEEKHAADSETRETDIEHQIAQNIPESSLKELERETHNQSENSLESSTEAPAVATVTEAHEEPDTQLNATEEHLPLPASQPGIQNTTEEALVEPNLPPQQARTTPPDGEQGEIEMVVEGAVEESQGAKHPETSDTPEKTNYSYLRTPNGKDIQVLAWNRKRWQSTS